ncbi:hypothetical protein NN561_020152 [Cricetulus griseus]
MPKPTGSWESVSSLQPNRIYRHLVVPQGPRLGPERCCHHSDLCPVVGQSQGSAVWSCREEARILFLDSEALIPQSLSPHSFLGGEGLDLSAFAPRGSSWGSKLKYCWAPNALKTRVAPQERLYQALLSFWKTEDIATKGAAYGLRRAGPGSGERCCDLVVRMNHRPGPLEKETEIPRLGH